jgi:acetyl-CoA decarbonylase/synthase complex subunit gamma
MSYLVPAGLYAIGAPSRDDQVVVTANYKMSYDIVRRELAGRNVWLLVLETFGINVWCAAGKGTFGTDELVRRIGATGLARVVKHRRLLLPILGAPGVAAHEVARRTGFSVRYATIRAADLPAFLDNGMITTPAMRQLTFTFRERLVLVPVELAHAWKPILLTAGLLFIAAGVGTGGFRTGEGLAALLAYLGAVLTGIVATPLLLPWLPTASFAVKGALAGAGWTAIFYLLAGRDWGAATTAAALLALPAVSAFFALNFTGSTPFASRSGVKKEMRLTMPAMGGALLGGALLWLCGKVL